MAEQNRGPQARKIELERRLDANAETGRRQFAVRTDGVTREEDLGRDATPHQQSSGRGHKAQQATARPSGRPGGGNMRGATDE